ncbi:MAG: arginine--tRNA ligase [Armatimonadota bacterium]
MFRDALRAQITQAISRAIASSAIAAGEIPAFDVEIPKDRRFGDYATNAAMVLAKHTGGKPRDIAQRLIDSYAASPDRIARLEVAGPGFINIRIAWPWKRELVATICRLGEDYGLQTVGAGRRVNVEFVSANPAGPLHVGTGRGAVVGDVLSNLLAALGYRVSREYYINDAGEQVRHLALSVEARYFELLGQLKDLPENGYRGDYVVDLARGIAAKDGDAWLRAPEDARLDHFRDVSVEAMVADAHEVLERFGIRFDIWVSERALVRSGAVDRAVAALRERGVLYEGDGNLWFRSTAFGDDKDRVIVRGSGEATYFGRDIAYHLDKLARGSEQLIDVWGIDHIGAVERLKGALAALEVPRDAFEILIHQHVRLKNEGEALRMSRRRGEFVALRDLIEAVGVDAARYFYAMTSFTIPMDFDVGLALQHSQDNPIYYVQYAHARIAGILREAGLLSAGNPTARTATAEAPLDRLEDEREAALIHVLAELPEVIRAAGLRREPHRLCAYAREVAEAFHVFYTHCRVLTDDASLTAARLALVDATRIVLRRILGLLGVSAPDRM